MAKLSEQKCTACRADAPRVSPDESASLLHDIPGWSITQRDGIEVLTREFKFADFQEAMDFTVRVGHAAEDAGHHPAILVEWGKVTVTWWTHKIRGLHRNDFIMAARTDALDATG